MSEFCMLDSFSTHSKSMILQQSRICFALAFAANYPGNFIVILENFAEYLRCHYEATIIWVFPKQDKKAWSKKIEEKYKVHWMDAPSTALFTRIFQEHDIDIVHSHFEAYDKMISKAVKRLEKQKTIKQIWHVHDDMSYNHPGAFVLSFLRHLRRVYHYNFRGSEAVLIPVNSALGYYLAKIRKAPWRFPVPKGMLSKAEEREYNIFTLPNGINIERLQLDSTPIFSIDSTSPYTFLSLSGSPLQKRPDILIEAGKLIAQKETSFKVILTRREGTLEFLQQKCGNIENLPWLSFVEEDVQIGNLIRRADCFVSTSVHETQSMAVAEATLLGIPVIQSNIPGTLWNASNPSAFVFESMNALDLSRKMEDVMRMSRKEMLGRVEETRKRNMLVLSEKDWQTKLLEIYTS